MTGIISAQCGYGWCKQLSSDSVVTDANRIGYGCSLEYTDIPELFFAGQCCPSMISCDSRSLMHLRSLLHHCDPVTLLLGNVSTVTSVMLSNTRTPVPLLRISDPWSWRFLPLKKECDRQTNTNGSVGCSLLTLEVLKEKCSELDWI